MPALLSTHRFLIRVIPLEKPVVISKILGFTLKKIAVYRLEKKAYSSLHHEFNRDVRQRLASYKENFTSWRASSITLAPVIRLSKFFPLGDDSILFAT
jgi:hypothetical protein